MRRRRWPLANAPVLISQRSIRNSILILSTLLCWSASKASCWEEAGRSRGIDPLLLKAIAWQESRGHPNAVGPKLPGGNVALGLMQINTVHLPKLKKYGIKREDLFDACTSQHVGAWVLADCINQFGQKWRAVGCYYAGPASRNTKAQESYVRDVQRWYAGYLALSRRRAG
jgi:soluble lytic murein transglycosylase-like protein